MHSTDTFLRDCDRAVDYPKETWIEASEHVLTKLGEFLGGPLKYELPLDEYVNNGILIDIRCEFARSSRLGVFLKGIVASTIRDGVSGASVGATLFMYCNGKKVNAVTGESFIDLEYRIDNNVGEWQVVGWFKDEYGEHSEFDEP